MKNNIKEIIVMAGLVSIAILLVNPFHFWMPDMMVMAMLAVILALFGIFTSFVLRETEGDERDGIHRSLAGRNAFLAGSAALVLGIIIQGYYHKVDAWLVVALVVMVTAKIVTRWWADKNL
ncbi:MAG: hypothetical protein WCG20_01675 [bacterium]